MSLLIAAAAAATLPSYLVWGVGSQRECTSDLGNAWGWCGLSELRGGGGGWRPADDDANPSTVIHLGARYLVAGVATMRYGIDPGWTVTRFRVEYTDNARFARVSEMAKADEVWTSLGDQFAGPTAADDRDKLVDAPFAEPIQARFLRITPLEMAEFNGERRVGLRFAVRLATREAYTIGRCTPAGGCPRGDPINLVGCYNQNPEPGAVAPATWQYGGSGHNPLTCNTACLGHDHFALHDAGNL